MGHLWIVIVLASCLCIEARKEEPVDSVAVLCFVMHSLRYCEPRPSNPHVNPLIGVWARAPWPGLVLWTGCFEGCWLLLVVLCPLVCVLVG